MRQAFASLVRATVEYLQQDLSTEVLEEKHPPQQTTTPPPPKKIEPKIPSTWTLNPMPLPTEVPPRFASHFTAYPLHNPIRLFVDESCDTLFLEGLARAITQNIAPATLFSGNLDDLLTDHSLHLVIAPLSHLKKRFSQVELHQLIRFEGPTLLPIAETYDLELKRALWNTLKSFPNLPPSS